MALILSRDDLDRCLDMTSAIAAMRLAFNALSTGEAQAPQRQAINLAEQGLALLMPSLLQTGQQHSFGLKIITVMPRNPLRNLPRLSATVLLLDATTGQTLAIMEGNWLTAMRTGAVSGTRPLFHYNEVEAGTQINAIGAFLYVYRKARELGVGIEAEV